MPYRRPTGRRPPSASCGSWRCAAHGAARPLCVHPGPVSGIAGGGGTALDRSGPLWTALDRSGPLWTALVALHTQAREHGQYAWQSQSVQALWQKLVANVAANVATAPELRRQEFAETGRIQTKSPHPPTAFQTVVWTRYLTEKAARRGISLEWIDEASSTSTGRQSGRVRPAAPRRFRRAGCGARAVARGLWRAGAPGRERRRQ